MDYNFALGKPHSFHADIVASFQVVKNQIMAADTITQITNINADEAVPINAVQLISGGENGSSLDAV